MHHHLLFRRDIIHLGTRALQWRAGHHQVDLFSDIGDMIAGTLKTFGNEQQLDRILDRIRFLLHLQQQMCKQFAVDAIQLDITA